MHHKKNPRMLKDKSRKFNESLFDTFLFHIFYTLFYSFCTESFVRKVYEDIFQRKERKIYRILSDRRRKETNKCVAKMWLV